ncbi:type II secretion system protein [Dehalogenimonas sp. 4OHTPN]|uniref:Type II secretion system protein n=1 Tax=Dehalogenimonas sp. 4OHTPN TaxID=3166643 RepID=A0AAU8GBK0_9CHLR
MNARTLIRISRRERGFTLVEILVAMAILTVIMAAVAMTTMSIFNTNDLSQNRTLAIRNVQNAGQWMSRDALQATHMSFGGVNGFVLTLTEDLTAYVGSPSVKVITYQIVGNNLQRTETINAGAPSTQTIASGVQYFADIADATAPTWFRQAGAVFELKITVVVGTGNNAATEVRFYKIEPRPDNV